VCLPVTKTSSTQLRPGFAAAKNKQTWIGLQEFYQTISPACSVALIHEDSATQQLLHGSVIRHYK
jgi:hypothetical protein